MSAVYDHCFKTVLRLTQEVGKMIRSRINEAKTVNTKDSEIDFVTETDKEVEKTLISGLSAEFPDHKFVGEESTSEGKSQKVVLTNSPTWVIDPVDGTLNFVHGYPHVCVSIALLVEKVPEIAIIYNPVVNQMFTARKGLGAFLNDQPIKASKTEDLSKALVCFEFGCSRNPEKMNFVKENVLRLFPQVHGYEHNGTPCLDIKASTSQGNEACLEFKASALSVLIQTHERVTAAEMVHTLQCYSLRSLGSAALDMAMVACGGADVYLEAGIHAWDVAAGDLIVREAGGVVMDPSGGPFDVLSRRVLCAGTKSLADQMVKTVTQYYPPRDDAE